MIYVDTSVFVRVLTREAKTELALSWLDRRRAGSLCASVWVLTEFASAIALKERRGEFDRSERDRVLIEWQAFRAGGVKMIDVPNNAFVMATQLIDQPGSTLRAGDALHLAVASLGGHSLATLDEGLANAAVRAGVPVERLG